MIKYLNCLKMTMKINTEKLSMHFKHVTFQFLYKTIYLFKHLYVGILISLIGEFAALLEKTIFRIFFAVSVMHGIRFSQMISDFVFVYYGLVV